MNAKFETGLKVKLCYKYCNVDSPNAVGHITIG